MRISRKNASEYQTGVSGVIPGNTTAWSYTVLVAIYLKTRKTSCGGKARYFSTMKIIILFETLGRGCCSMLDYKPKDGRWVEGRETIK